MPPPIIAISIDGLSPALLDEWMASGRAEHLARLRRSGAYGHLHNPEHVPTESSWSTFLLGATPDRTGQWGHVEYDPRSYRYEEMPAHSQWRHPPIHALDPQRRVCLFDVPLDRLHEDLNGVQVLGWGAETNQALQQSRPPGLIEAIIERHGLHPLHQPEDATHSFASGSHGGRTVSYRCPNMYNQPALGSLGRRLQTGGALRGRIVRELMGDEHWDLLLAIFSEVHTAGHLLWHIDQPHPLHQWATRAQAGADDKRIGVHDVFASVDRAIGQIVEAAPDGATVVIFSLNGIIACASELPLMLFLPEFLFRWQFGEAALAGGDPESAVPPPSTHYSRHWKDEIWALRTPLGESSLESPAAQGRRGDPLDWNPTNWFRPMWPTMRAFALPAYQHGMVRINVAGREGAGIVLPMQYDETCERLIRDLRRLVNPRSGRAIVKDVIRTRASAFDEPEGAPPADLIVLWDEQEITDTVQSPEIGRIGPAPYFRTGSHSRWGFCLLSGPGIRAGVTLPEGSCLTDLSATMLDLLGAEVPPHVRGRSLLPACTGAGRSPEAQVDT